MFLFDHVVQNVRYPQLTQVSFSSQTPHYSFGSLTRPLIQHSFPRSFPFVIASGSSHSLLSVSFTFCIIFPTPRDSLRPQAFTLSTAENCIAFACIRSNLACQSFKVHFLYRSFAHIFHRPISPVQHRTSFQNLLCCHVQVARAHAIIHTRICPF